LLNANGKIGTRKQNEGWRKGCSLEKLRFFGMKGMKYFVLETANGASVLINRLIMNC
jgi:hypothetical protein